MPEALGENDLVVGMCETAEEDCRVGATRAPHLLEGGGGGGRGPGERTEGNGTKQLTIEHLDNDIYILNNKN